LVLILSTDWFAPFWSEIGLNLETVMHNKMKEGCRGIISKVLVKKSVDGAEAFDYIDWSEACKLETKSRLLKLSKAVGVSDVVANVTEEWEGWDHDGLKSALMLRMFTDDLIDGATIEGIASPNFAIRAIVVDTDKRSDRDPNEFEKIEENCSSAWDRYLRDLLDDQPNALSTNLYHAINVHRMKVWWGYISARLTVEQRKELISWYRAMAESQMPFDPMPSFVKAE